MSTAVFNILSTICQYLTLYRLFVLCHYVHCCLLQSVHCLSVLHNVPSVGSASLWQQFSTFCPLSVSTTHSTDCWFCVIISTAAFYSLSTVCQYLTISLCWFCVTRSTAVFYSLSNVCKYLTLYRLLVLCLYVQCRPVLSVHCLSVSHNVPSVCSVSQIPLLTSTVCPLSVSTSHWTVYLFCDTLLTAAFYSLSTVRQYFTLTQYSFCVTLSSIAFFSLYTVSNFLSLYPSLFLCHCVPCCLIESVQCLSLPNTLPYVGFVSLGPHLSSTVCQLSISTSHCTVYRFCVTMSTAIFYSLSSACQYLTMCRLLGLRLYDNRFLHSVHWVSVPHTVHSVGSVSYIHCRHLQSVHCVSVPHNVVGLVLRHYVHCCLLQFVHCLSLTHIVPSLVSVWLCPLLPSTIFSLLVNSSYGRSRFSRQSLHCCQLQIVHCMSLPHSILSVGFVWLRQQLPPSVCPKCVINPHCTVCRFCVTLFTPESYFLSTVCQCFTLYLLFFVTLSSATLYSLPSVCQNMTLYPLLFVFHCAHCSLLHPVQCLSVLHTLPSVGFVSLWPLLSSKIIPWSVSTSHRSICLFCDFLSNAGFYCLSGPYIVPYESTVSLCPLLSSRVCPLSVSTSHCTVP
jgi:hypothetical protein